MSKKNLSDESVQTDTESALIEEEYSDENDEHTMLIKEIGKMQKEIYELRSQLASGYSRADVSMKEIMENKRKCTPNNESFSKRKRVSTPHTLELMFYGMFMKMDINKDQKCITVLLCVPGRQTFGLTFIKSSDADLYKLHRCCLPYSVKVEEEMLKAKSLSQMQIVEYVKSIRANIHAYHMRLDQVKQLQKRLDKKLVYFYHSICYTHIELQFRVKVREDDDEYRVILKLHYSLLQVRPSDMNIVSPDNDLSNEQLGMLLKKIHPLENLPLPELYDTIFSAESSLTIL